MEKIHLNYDTTKSYKEHKWKWKSLSRVWLCDPMDYRAHGILQARILEWVTFPFSRRSSQPRDGTHVSRNAGGFFTAEPQGKPKEHKHSGQKMEVWVREAH